MSLSALSLKGDLGQFDKVNSYDILLKPEVESLGINEAEEWLTNKPVLLEDSSLRQKVTKEAKGNA